MKKDLFEYLEEASKIVASWPEWKQKGSDSTYVLRRGYNNE